MFAIVVPRRVVAVEVACDEDITAARESRRVEVLRSLFASGLPNWDDVEVQKTKAVTGGEDQFSELELCRVVRFILVLRGVQLVVGNARLDERDEPPPLLTG